MNACCSSPASICYWLTASLIAWAILAAVGFYWHPLHGSAEATCLLAASIGCFANAIKNRTYHCVITGPLLLVAAILDLTWVRTRNQNTLLWGAVIVGVLVAFTLEWRYLRNSKNQVQTCER